MDTDRTPYGLQSVSARSSPHQTVRPPAPKSSCRTSAFFAHYRYSWDRENYRSFAITICSVNTVDIGYMVRVATSKKLTI